MRRGAWIVTCQGQFATGEALAHPAVVRDRDQGASVVGEGCLQLLDQCRGEVVGGFVEQQQVDRVGEAKGEFETAALTGGESA